MESYTVYGHFYDATQGTRFGVSYLRLLRKHHPQARSLLEIACGTGALLESLAQHYVVTGLDLSRTMLRYAREKLPGVRLHHQNMVGFKLDSTFDAVICPYDSMNHVLRFTEWVRTFEAVRRHLNPGGIFIFDINTEYRLHDLARLQPWTRSFGENRVIMNVSMSKTGIADWEIEVFERKKSGLYRLHREVIQERSFAHDQIMKTLTSCFSEVSAYDGTDWSRPKATSRRLFYVCSLATQAPGRGSQTPRRRGPRAR
jgi:SAM-dependent methyltransferase